MYGQGEGAVGVGEEREEAEGPLWDMGRSMKRKEIDERWKTQGVSKEGLAGYETLDESGDEEMSKMSLFFLE